MAKMTDIEMFELMVVGSFNVLFTDHEYESLVGNIEAILLTPGVVQAIKDHHADSPCDETAFSSGWTPKAWVND